MSKEYFGKLFIYAIFSFICGILVRMVVLSGSNEMVFYRTLEPQFALVAEANN